MSHMALFGLTRHLKQERAGFALYGAAVAAARAPYFYAVLGVPDTLDGRFDLVGIHAFLIIRRLGAADDKQAKLVAQAVFDAMFSDMDINLREIGVGDMVIGKRVRAMWEAFHGRCAAYETALESDDPQELESALARNVWRGEPDADAMRLARIVRAQDAALQAAPVAPIVGGSVAFLEAEAAAQ
jgi:cytochrome b pre-mRNA-processing protein 3